MRQIKDMTALLAKLRCPAGFVSINAWHSLVCSIAALLELRSALDSCSIESTEAECHSTAEYFSNNSKKIDPIPLHRAHDLIARVVDFELECTEESTSQSEAIIQRGVCAELDDLKDLHDALPDILVKVAQVNDVPFYFILPTTI